jgi:hypothetical protein
VDCQIDVFLKIFGLKNFVRRFLLFFKKFRKKLTLFFYFFFGKITEGIDVRTEFFGVNFGLVFDEKPTKKLKISGNLTEILPILTEISRKLRF